jgi:hypothetical protein
VYILHKPGTQIIVVVVPRKFPSRWWCRMSNAPVQAWYKYT